MRSDEQAEAQNETVRCTMRPHRLYASLLASLLVCGCSAWPDPGRHSVVSLPLNFAWMDGRKVEYITTDISDPAMARALGVNLVPRLAQALPAPGRPSVVERVYKFADDTQITVFQSAPSPTGPANADASYSPLWRMVLLRWTQPSQARELTSEEQILSAVDANELSMAITDIVVNCPITRSVDGHSIAGTERR
nr:hypothetical protein [uncultured Roseateles sp.]